MKTLVTLKGTIGSEGRKGNGVVYSDFLNADTGEKYDLVAFARVPVAQKLLLADSANGSEVEVSGELARKSRGLAIYVDTLRVIDSGVSVPVEQDALTVENDHDAHLLSISDPSGLHWQERNHWRWLKRQQTGNMDYLFADDDKLTAV